MLMAQLCVIEDFNAEDSEPDSVSRRSKLVENFPQTAADFNKRVKAAIPDIKKYKGIPESEHESLEVASEDTKDWKQLMKWGDWALDLLVRQLMFTYSSDLTNSYRWSVSTK